MSGAWQMGGRRAARGRAEWEKRLDKQTVFAVLSE